MAKQKLQNDLVNLNNLNLNIYLYLNNIYFNLKISLFFTFVLCLNYFESDCCLDTHTQIQRVINDAPISVFFFFAYRM